MLILFLPPFYGLKSGGEIFDMKEWWVAVFMDVIEKEKQSLAVDVGFKFIL